MGMIWSFSRKWYFPGALRIFVIIQIDLLTYKFSNEPQVRVTTLYGRDFVSFVARWIFTFPLEKRTILLFAISREIS